MLEPGRRVGPFEIVGPLGSGGMGQVYRARDVRLEREVALKFLHSVEGPRATARIMHEARAASALNHPNICHVYDVGESEDEPWIAMELVDGVPLNDRIATGALSIHAAVRFAIQIADALAHAHDRGIVHRDLKSSNIVCSGDRAIVLDFGIARRIGPAVDETATRSGGTIADSQVGTVAYAAPEVLRGALADARSDLWALGVVLFEMATGTRPFTGTTTYEVASAILENPTPPLPGGLPASFRSVVSRLLQKEPTLRYATAAEVRAALQTIESEPVSRARRAWLPWAVSTVIVAAAAITWAVLPARAPRLSNLQLLSTFDGSHASPALSPDGDLLAFVAKDADGIPQVWIKNLPEGAPVKITSGPAAAERPRWHPKTKQIVFARRGQGIWSVAPLGGTPTRLVQSGFNPDFSRDGERLVWEITSDIFVAASDGSTARKIARIPPRFYSVPRRPALSPDGRRIAFFQAELGPNGDLWVVSADGGDARRLTTDVREAGAPVWTPDGRRIIYSSARAGSRTLWHVRADGGEPEPLTTGTGEDDEPELSADGRRLIFTNVRNTWQIRAANAAGERTLLDRRRELLMPLFSPDGSRITFFGRAQYAVAIFTMARDGSDIRQLTGDREINHHPRWSADGEWVWFYQARPKVTVRRVPALGGAAVDMLPWDWHRQSSLSFDRSGRLLVYTWQYGPGEKGSEPEVTRIRDVARGTERDLPPPHMHHPKFSPDGAWIAGSRHDGIGICRTDGAQCRLVVKLPGLAMAQWSQDGSRIYFLRPSLGAGEQELASIAVDGADERTERRIGPFRAVDRHFDMSSVGELVWAPFLEGRRELWFADLN